MISEQRTAEDQNSGIETKNAEGTDHSEFKSEQRGTEMPLKHPNMEVSDNGDTVSQFRPRMEQSKGCAYYFAKLDEEILRPLFIYKYDEEEMWY
jgi:hypothetical protein